MQANVMEKPMVIEGRNKSNAALFEALSDINKQAWASFSEELSDATRKVYQSDILNFLYWLGKDITELQAGDMEEYLRKVTFEGVNAKAANRKLSSNRSMCKFLASKGVLSNNPLLGIATLTDDTVVNEKTVLTWQQIQQCKDLGGFKYLMFEAVYLKGLTLHESALYCGVTAEKFQYNIKKLGEELGINMKYSDLVETREKFFSPCPSCGVKHEMSEGNWKFNNGLMVCQSC